MDAWGSATATTVGESHVIRGRGSDDAVVTARNEKWTTIVACDGAGSSGRSRDGADFVSSAFAKQLLEISAEIDRAGPGPWLNDALILGILNIRKELASVAGSYDLRDFHCTLVAVLVSQSGGLSVHIGDGAVFTGRRTSKGTFQIDVHSEPENGEYSNETFFVTETTWLRNLRIKPLGPCDWVVVTTDGASSLLFTHNIKQDVFAELFDALSAEDSLDGVAAVLIDLIEGEYALACSNDDKSIGLAFRAHSVFLDNWKTSEANSGGPKLADRVVTAIDTQLQFAPAYSAAPRNFSALAWQRLSSRPNLPAIVIIITSIFSLVALFAVGYFFFLKPKMPDFVPEPQCLQPLSNQPYLCGL